MKGFQYIAILICFLLSFQGNAQQEMNLKAADTTKSTINPNAPAKAAFYSALVPGLGQAYNKKYWKIPIVYIGLGSGLYFYTWNQKKYQGFRDEYKKRLAGTSLGKEDSTYGSYSDDQLIRGQKFHQRNRDLSAFIMAGIYLLNIIDANVDAHLMQFNVNDNLSLKPELNQNEIDNNFNYGVKLTYNF